MLNEFMRDTLVLHKKDGSMFHHVRAQVSTKGIIIEDVRLPIEVGDKLTRTLPNGLTEEFIVDDPGYQEGVGDIPSHFQAKVHREATGKEVSPVQTSALRMLKAIYDETHDTEKPVDDVAW